MPSPLASITGLGCISALGHDVATFWDAIVHGRSGVGDVVLHRYDGLLVKVAAQVRGFDAGDHFSDLECQLLDPFSQYCVVAAREAISQSGLTAAEIAGDRTAVILGTGIGGSHTQDESYVQYYEEGQRRIRPMTVPRVMPSASVSAVSRAFGITGPCFTTTSACSSSNHALGTALWLMRQGVVDRVISGGSEACVNGGTMLSWQALKVLSPDVCRPFSKGRRGMILGEGAGIVMLERPEAAEKRGAKVFAEIAGFGMSSDAGDITRPDAEGAAKAMRMALADAEMNPDEVAFVNAHGTGTVLNDITETDALKRVFGDHANKLAISSTKSMHGHLLGGSGAVELVACAMALDTQTATPTAGWLERDPKCDLDYVPNDARDMPIGAALSNSFAFGGLNAVIALRRAGSPS